MKRLFMSHTSRVAVKLALLVALALVILTGGIAARPTPAQAAQVPMALYWYQCNALNHVAVFTERIHVFCQSTATIAGAPALDGAVTWFAFPTQPDSATASRFLSLLQTSVIAGRTIWLQLDPNDTSGSSFGCGAANCRRFTGVEMR